MDISLAQKAISHALKGEWPEAIKINLEIIDQNREDVDALNRLARAYSETGKIKEARETTNKVLVIDPVNSIAVRCIEKWKSFKKGEKGITKTTDPEAFLEEPGKTKIVGLLNTGDAETIASLDSGDEAKLMIAPHRISVTSSNGRYIGRLPDDLAARLKNLMKLGNKYRVLIKSIDGKEINVFVREVEKSKKSGSATSFSAEKIDYVSFTPPELIHKEGPEMDMGEETGEEI